MKSGRVWQALSPLETRHHRVIGGMSHFLLCVGWCYWCHRCHCRRGGLVLEVPRVPGLQSSPELPLPFSTTSRFSTPDVNDLADTGAVVYGIFSYTDHPIRWVALWDTRRPARDSWVSSQAHNAHHHRQEMQRNPNHAVAVVQA
jgi:hypothetical protein